MTISRFLSYIFLTAFLTGCTEDKSNGDLYLDRVHLTNEVVQLTDAWHQNAVTPNGFFKTGFYQDWRPKGDNDRVSVVGQSRLLYIFSAGYDLTGEEKYLDAVRRGGDFMLKYIRNSKGGWNRHTARNGDLISATVESYSYSFVIFGLSHAYRVTGEEKYLQAALQTWHSGVWPGLKAAKSFRIMGDVLVGTQRGYWTQNPFMHLFEALLVLHDVTKSEEVWSDIEDIAFFVKNKLLNKNGCLPEWYVAADYLPIKEDNKPNVKLGHQVEWSYLLSKAVDKGLDPSYLSVADKLYDFALTYGIDHESGVIFDDSDVEGVVTRKSHSWWPQAEFMRATIKMAARRKKTELWQLYDKTHLFSRIHYIDQMQGGWTVQSALLSNKPYRALDKVIGYHAVAFYQEALSQF